mgnify:CR=1 FL=1
MWKLVIQLIIGGDPGLNLGSPTPNNIVERRLPVDTKISLEPVLPHALIWVPKI